MDHLNSTDSPPAEIVTPASEPAAPTADQAWQYARQIVCEEWQRAVKQYGLLPGSQVETIVARIINRLDGDERR